MKKRNVMLVSTFGVLRDGGDKSDLLLASVAEFFKGVGEVLFIPWAVHQSEYGGYAKEMDELIFRQIGVKMRSIHTAESPLNALGGCEAIYVGGGNTFRLLDRFIKGGFIPCLQQRVRQGIPYMGSSAGANIACPTIMTTNDMPIVWTESPKALNLIPFQINPHYLDPNPDLRHHGETREQRIMEYHEENDTPVLGLREGSWIHVTEDEVMLGGPYSARLFQKGKAPEEHSSMMPGSLDFLLEE